jgi:polar amino acid transport system substrate-binding protein
MTINRELHVMFQSIKIGKIKFRIISTLVCFTYIFNSSYVLSQTKFPEVIRIGTRTAAHTLGTYDPDRKKIGGFCGYDFESALRKKLAESTTIIPRVTNQPVGNQYDVDKYDRYEGLLKEKIEIECGPNTRLSRKLFDEKHRQYYEDELTFSNPFYQSGIKLLLNKDRARTFKKHENELESKIRDEELHIGVMEKTSTYNQLTNYLKGKHVHLVPYFNRNVALTDLKSGKIIQAFASDALIIQTLLDEGMQDSKTEISIPPFKDSEFTLFPLEAKHYLFDLKEEHAIVIKKNTGYDKKLIAVINDTLSSISDSSYLYNVEKNSTIINEQKPKSPEGIPSGETGFTKTDPNMPWIFAILVLVVLVVVLIILVIERSKPRETKIIQKNKDGNNIGRDKRNN